MKKLATSFLLNCVTFAFLGLAFSSCGGGGGSSDSGSGGDSSGIAQFGGNCGLKITNGETCSAGDGPIALVLLETADGAPGALCTGAFITNRHILTAAHCFASRSLSRIEVQIKSGIYGASRRYIPNSYNAAGPVLQSDDYAIVELASPIAGVSTLPLLASERITAGRTINVIGFGQDQSGQSVLQPLAFADGLRKGTMEVAGVDPATGIIVANYNPTGQSVCEGDSGGPAIVFSADGTAAIAGVAQAVGESQSSVIRCLENSSAFFTSVADGSLVSFVNRFAPDAVVF